MYLIREYRGYCVPTPRKDKIVSAYVGWALAHRNPSNFVGWASAHRKPLNFVGWASAHRNPSNFVGWALAHRIDGINADLQQLKAIKSN
ncbi:MAG: hypothetical protein JJV99_02530 [Colwellia sp.]|nr:hypothetical protein [Colwellia sp.]